VKASTNKGRERKDLLLCFWGNVEKVGRNGGEEKERSQRSNSLRRCKERGKKRGQRFGWLRVEN